MSASTSYRVVLFGWLQARSQHLSKYQQIWTSHPSLRAKRVSTFNSNLPILLSPGLTARRLDELAETLQSDRSNTPLVLHIMSNGGALACGEFAARFTSESGPDSIFNSPVRGVVFDSCPGILTASMAANGVLSSGGATSQSKIHTYLGDPVRALFRSYLALPGTRARIERAWGGLEELVPAAPRSFLYSKADAIIPYQNVEAFAERERSLGRRVMMRRWEDAPHVQLLRWHGEEYVGELRRLLDVGEAGALDLDEKTRV